MPPRSGGSSSSHRSSSSSSSRSFSSSSSHSSSFRSSSSGSSYRSSSSSFGRSGGSGSFGGGGRSGGGGSFSTRSGSYSSRYTAPAKNVSEKYRPVTRISAPSQSVAAPKNYAAPPMRDTRDNRDRREPLNHQSGNPYPNGQPHAPGNIYAPQTPKPIHMGERTYYHAHPYNIPAYWSPVNGQRTGNGKRYVYVSSSPRPKGPMGIGPQLDYRPSHFPTFDLQSKWIYQGYYPGYYHVFFFVPKKWEESGRLYKAGYYDEDGYYYPNYIQYNNGFCSSLCNCPHCGETVELQWNRPGDPYCPACGRMVEGTESWYLEDASEPTDWFVEDISAADAAYRATKANERLTPWPDSKKKESHPILTGIIVLSIFFVALGFLSGGSSSGSGDTAGNRSTHTSQMADADNYSDQIADTDQSVYYDDNASKKAARYGKNSANTIAAGNSIAVSSEGIDYGASSIYIKEFGRECQYMKEYESYYDEVTDCYFVYQEEFETWQYWYEGISSAYGDYGWMEYDTAETRWYIETDEGQWQVYDGKTDNLWYFE